MDDSIGTRIAAARERAGMNRNQLARALGTSWQHVDHWEKGRTKPTVESVRRLSELLDVSVDALLGIESAPAPRTTLERFLRERAPADLTADEERWLRQAPLDDARATPDDYRDLVERVRAVGRRRAATARVGSGTRRKVDGERLAEALSERRGETG
ncbi:MAG TPA: helix-turn-helix transcriptional regulator [Sandaracinaceae bacterium LLY-WYZ-13_1]|nr:helix-turn-helix transcriptional regulator [Sandaracinaceae bacterium LLY-WYZ-13_1]